MPAADEATVGGIAELLQDRIEEPRGALSSGQFWSFTDELLPLVVEALYEATLISGEPQLQTFPFTLAANSFRQAMPPGIVALTKVEAPNYSVQKTRLWDMDQFLTGWEQTAAQATFSGDPSGQGPFWFPLGLNQWAIYPMVSAAVVVNVSGIGLPVPATRPYSATQATQLQEEYADAIADMAACCARLKEAGPDFLAGMAQYDDALAKFVQLSSFSYRKGSLKFTRALGAASGITPVRQK